MTPTYHSSFPPFTIDLNQEHHHHHDDRPQQHQPLFFCSEAATQDVPPSSSSISYPTFIDPPHEEVGYRFHRQLQRSHHQEEGNTHASHGESWDHPTLDGSGMKLSVCKQEEIAIGIVQDQRESSSFKWMPSKMRLMKKMMTLDNTTTQQAGSIHKFEEDEIKKPSSPSLHDNITKNLSANGNNSIRVCSDCNTTKTPLWRSGPRGPKSLCNACGIRQRKARRAMAAAQASANGAIPASGKAAMKTNKVQDKEKKTNNNSLLPFKKRCKFTSQSKPIKKKLCFEDLASIIMSKNSAFQHLFPQDEKEAAILLMALSYGMVHG